MSSICPATRAACSSRCRCHASRYGTRPARTISTGRGYVSALWTTTARTDSSCCDAGVNSRLAARVGLAVALALAIVVGRSWGHHPGAGAAPLPPPTRVTVPATAVPSAPPERVTGVPWRAVVAELERRRSAAYDAGAPSLLAPLYAAASPTGAADVARLHRLARLRLHTRGLTGRVMRVVVRFADTTHATLVTTDRWTGYAIVDRRGRLVARRPGRERRTFLIRLVEVAGGWRIAAVRPR